ncbi:hypothetical protein [Terasakiella pusilla]|uniref:hypothetical protein n=1 Tax=Terasakiella pusilla TaxID=64973 RepID=UPI003AA8D468
MKIIKYRASLLEKSTNITKVECQRETAKCVYINGFRETKIGYYWGFFDTWEEAHSYLLGLAKEAVAEKSKKLNEARDVMAFVFSMDKPDAA